MSEPREILNIEQAADLLGVSVKTFNEVLHSERIPARKIGREWKFSRQALIDWVGSGVSLDFYREASSTHVAGGGGAHAGGAHSGNGNGAHGGTLQPMPRQPLGAAQEGHAPQGLDQDHEHPRPASARRTTGWKFELD